MEQIYIEVFAEPLEFKTWPKEQQQWWINNYLGDSFSLSELKWHPDYKTHD